MWYLPMEIEFSWVGIVIVCYHTKLFNGNWGGKCDKIHMFRKGRMCKGVTKKQSALSGFDFLLVMVVSYHLLRMALALLRSCVLRLA